MATMVRWNPFREMAAMQSIIDHAFDEKWRTARATTDGSLALDVHETTTGYTVYAALPGANADNIQVNVNDGVLTISGEIAQPTVENSRTLMLERTFGTFTRSIRLPQTVDLSGVEATFENGVLTLNLPKSPEAQPRQIPVRVAGSPSKN
ncbi:MAG: Hsp20/alpha crystallin family protein [Chloroflexota bacterium]|nr:Hsp20/alpha crystallin family protein [Chloroflexota bacterium]